MASHLELCPECRARLEAYRSVSARLEAGSGEESVAGERVWERLSARCGGFAAERRVPRFREPFWRRSVSLPLPAAAAAAALAAFALFAAVFRSPAPARGQDPVIAGIPEDRIMVPAAGMNGVLQYLDGDANADSPVLMLRLPEGTQFIRPGKPTFVKMTKR